MSTSGNTTHCDVDFLAGHNNDAKGNAGLCSPVLGSVRTASFLAFVLAAELEIFLFLDLWGELGTGISVATADAARSAHVAP